MSCDHVKSICGVGVGAETEEGGRGSGDSKLIEGDRMLNTVTTSLYQEPYTYLPRIGAKIYICCAILDVMSREDFWRGGVVSSATWNTWLLGRKGKWIHLVSKWRQPLGRGSRTKPHHCSFCPKPSFSIPFNWPYSSSLPAIPVDRQTLVARSSEHRHQGRIDHDTRQLRDTPWLRCMATLAQRRREKRGVQRWRQRQRYWPLAVWVATARPAGTAAVF